MKLWIMSDLHQNADDKQLLPEQKPEHDVLILAGDISPSIVEARRYACTLTSKPSILVAGNHEFYGRCIDHELDALEAIEGYDETDFLKSLSSTLGEEHSFENEEFKDHVEMVSSRAHFLENRSVIIGDVRFLGCTLWTDYQIFNPTHSMDAMVTAEKYLSDHHLIKTRYDVGSSGKRCFLPHDALARHRQSRVFLETELRKPFDGKTIVVTHYAPHPIVIRLNWS